MKDAAEILKICIEQGLMEDLGNGNTRVTMKGNHEVKRFIEKMPEMAFLYFTHIRNLTKEIA